MNLFFVSFNYNLRPFGLAGKKNKNKKINKYLEQYTIYMNILAVTWVITAERGNFVK